MNYAKMCFHLISLPLPSPLLAPTPTFSPLVFRGVKYSPPRISKHHHVEDHRVFPLSKVEDDYEHTKLLNNW